MNALTTLREAFASRKPEQLIPRQRGRLASIVSHARNLSPYYRDVYRGLPDRIEDPTLLPITDKKKLMAGFDAWSTDRDVTLEKVRPFVDNPDRVGERFLGRYTIATTSGTTGTPGVFVIDDHAMQVTNAMALRMMAGWLGAADVVAIALNQARTAMTVASGTHSATAVAAARFRKSRTGRKRVLPLSPHARLAEMVAQLNAFRPALFAPYASIAKLLAAEQEAGGLNINPVLVVPSAEGLSPAEYERIAMAFDAKVRHSYAATECTFLSYSCGQGWLHVNSDWVVLEPVDADYRATAPGQQSHTVLITNLANRVQPILRYDLGDSVLRRPDRCPCGNPLPAIRVQGRSADLLTFATEGEKLSIPPLAFSSLMERIPDVELYQIVHTPPLTLRVRLRAKAGADLNLVWQKVSDGIKRLLKEHKLDHVAVERGDEPPEQSAGGKYRQVIPLR